MCSSDLPEKSARPARRTDTRGFMRRAPEARKAALLKRRSGMEKTTSAMERTSNRRLARRPDRRTRRWTTIPRRKVSGPAPGRIFQGKFRRSRDTTDTAREVSYNGRVGWRPPAGTAVAPGHFRPTRIDSPNRGRTGFDRMARGSDRVSWLVGWPR